MPRGSYLWSCSAAKLGEVEVEMTWKLQAFKQGDGIIIYINSTNWTDMTFPASTWVTSGNCC